MGSRSQLSVTPSDSSLTHAELHNLPSSLGKSRERLIRMPRGYYTDRVLVPASTRSAWGGKRPTWGGAGVLSAISPDMAGRSQSTGRVGHDPELSRDNWQLDKQFLMAMLKEMQAERSAISTRLDAQIVTTEMVHAQIKGLHEDRDHLRSMLAAKDKEIDELKQGQSNPNLSHARERQKLHARSQDLMESVETMGRRLKVMSEINRSLRMQLATLSLNKAENQRIASERWQAAVVIQKNWRRWIQQQRYKDVVFEKKVQEKNRSIPEGDKYQRARWITGLSLGTIAVCIIGLVVAADGEQLPSAPCNQNSIIQR